MKILAILAASFFLLAATNCEKPPKPPPIVYDPISPKFPEEIHNFYVVDAAQAPWSEYKEAQEMVLNFQDLPTYTQSNASYACLKFDIISKHPFKLKYVGQTVWTDCNGVGGYQPKDHQKFYNFVDDLSYWAEHREVKSDTSELPSKSSVHAGDRSRLDK